MSTATLAAVWERYANAGHKPRRERNAAGASTWFNWTAHEDHGPNEDIFGSLPGKRVLELGCGTGGNAAHLATLGAHCTALDVSPTQVRKARERWGHLAGLEFVEAEALEYLTTSQEQFDVVYSVFGAAWFTDPAVLLPAVRSRLSGEGMYAFSQVHPADAPPQPARSVRRYDLTGNEWLELLERHGFPGAWAWDIPGPTPDSAGALRVVAYA